MAITVTIHGAGGRMGRALVELVRAAPDLELASLWDRPDHPRCGQDLYGVGVALSGAWATAPGQVIVDFSLPQGLRGLVAGWPDHCESALISGTTGVTTDGFVQLDGLAQTRPVFYAANMSMGILALRMLAKRAAELLDDDWDVELVEMHHNRKVDAPSGTAVALVETVQEAWPVELVPVTGRSGQCGARGPGEMGVFALRGGSVVGEHELIFAGPEETLRLSHRAESRDLFARGALKVIRWLVEKVPGRYGMDDLVEE